MRVDRVDNVQGSEGSRGPPSNMIPLVLGSLTVPCPWAPEGERVCKYLDRECLKGLLGTGLSLTTKEIY